ncbi:MAG: hypothetical protein R3C18_07020 [Planctomycetaceae bacterium]
MSRLLDNIGKIFVPNTLRLKPIPHWQRPLAESGSRWKRFGRFLFRAYLLAQHHRRSDLPGPAWDLMIVLVTLALAIGYVVI